MNIGFFIVWLSDDYHHQIFKGVADKAYQLGVNLIVFRGSSINQSIDPYVEWNNTVTEGYDYQNNLVYYLADPSFLDGIIVSGSIFNFLSPMDIRNFLKPFEEIPLVSLGYEFSFTSNIMVDNTQGIIEVVKHLKEKHGRKKIAFVNGPEDNLDAKLRLEAFKEGLKEAGLPFLPELLYTGYFVPKGGENAVIEWLDKRNAQFDAVIAANDHMALGAMRELIKRGIRVPEDVSLTGFDDMVECMQVSPPLTTIAQPIYRQGASALEELIDRIRNKTGPKTCLLKTEMVIRESCGCSEKKQRPVNETDFYQSRAFELTPRSLLFSRVDKLLHSSQIQGIAYRDCKQWIDTVCRDVKPIDEEKIDSWMQKILDLMESFGSITPYFWMKLLEVLIDFFTEENPGISRFLKDKSDSTMRILERNIFYRRSSNEELIPIMAGNMFYDFNYKNKNQDIYSILQKWLPSIQIRTFYLFQFPEVILNYNRTFWKIPSKVLLQFVMIDGRTVLKENECCLEADPYKFIPSDFLDNQDRGCYYYHLLSYAEMCFGYFIVRIDSDSYNQYEYLAGLISSHYHTRYINNQKDQVQKQLLKRNWEIEKRNQEIESEILMARKIQSQLIPIRSPRENLAYLYRPMDAVGGDFFDFLSFRDKNALGIFVSDVSGHGVPAAFITSMIKTAISQMRDRHDNPAKLLSSLNESLFNQIGGNFVTAFYGLYFFESRQFIYANAGHNAPILLENGSLRYLDNNNRSIPLGVMDSNELQEKNKDYTNQTIQLSLYNKLILYTDGLTESQNQDKSGGDFEKEKLEESLLSHAQKSVHELVQAVFTDLGSFHGSESFEDDICIICLEVS